MKKQTLKAVRKKAPVKTKVSRKKPAAERKKRIPEKQKSSSARNAQSEVAIEAAKFTAAVPTQSALEQNTGGELPQSYGADTMVLLVRDPWWLYSFWEATPATVGRIRGEVGSAFDAGQWTLRVYDVSFIDFDGTNAHRFFDIALADGVSHWYIDTQAPGRSWCADLGVLLPDGRFITVLRSNVVQTPSDGPSWVTDEEWMVPEELFAELYGIGFGFGTSSAGMTWEERMKRAFAMSVSSGSGGRVTSPGASIVRIP